jgi:HEPN domain-containing protein
MKEIIQGWITKADHDLKIAMSEMKTDDPAYDMICYHFQQFVEKYIKAWMIFVSVEPPRSHNIHLLLEQCFSYDASFKLLIEKHVGDLTIYATDTRYPDNFLMPDTAEAQKALELTLLVKEFILNKLNLFSFDRR